MIISASGPERISMPTGWYYVAESGRPRVHIRESSVICVALVIRTPLFVLITRCFIFKMN